MSFIHLFINLQIKKNNRKETLVEKSERHVQKNPVLLLEQLFQKVNLIHGKKP